MNESLCLGCGSSKLDLLLDLGAQPPSNRFEHSDAPERDTHPLVVGQCQACGLLQLVSPMAPEMVRSRFEWLTYNEPEGHLDELVSGLRALAAVGPAARIIGLTYKDDTTIARFNRLGHANTYRYDPRTDLGIANPCAGLESIQCAFDASAAERLVARHGRADLLLARHVLEHAHRPRQFLEALALLVRPGGYLLFEMPDCSKFVQACDYCFLWEEHITYFCAMTLRTALREAGLSLHRSLLYAYPLEDSLIAIAKHEPPAQDQPPDGGLTARLEQGREFGRRFAEVRAQMQSRFARWQKAGKRTALFGAGHLAAKFVNLYGLRDGIDCVIDDNANKQRLLMPGSRLPIRGSEELRSRNVDLCLLSLSPESEQKVRARNEDYLYHGGRFLSIFARSDSSVYREAFP